MKRKRSSGSYSSKRTKFQYENRPRQNSTPQSLSERKYIDNSVEDKPISTIFTTGWSSSQCVDPVGVGTLFVPTPGNDINQRVGKKIQLLKVTVRGQIFVPSVEDPGTINYPLIRVLLVQNLQTNGIQAAPGELLSSTTATGSGALFCFQNTNYFGKYKILRDKIIRPPPIPITYDATKVVASGYSVPFTLSYRFRKPCYMHFSGNGSDVANIVQNSLHMMAACDFDVSSPEIYYRARLTYYDI